MIRQMKYFQSVVRNHSFSEAAEECHISQSAISQQVQSLEKELGVQLLQRRNRKFILTPAGEYFYKKSLVLVADYERFAQKQLKWRTVTKPFYTLDICADITERNFDVH